jgi:hypothetical protein
VLQALLLLCVPILLCLISHLAVPELEDGRTHDMREYYYRHGRWMQGLLLAVLVSGLGILSRRPLIHSMQAALLTLVMLYAVSYVARPIG